MPFPVYDDWPWRLTDVQRARILDLCEAIESDAYPRGDGHLCTADHTPAHTRCFCWTGVACERSGLGTWVPDPDQQPQPLALRTRCDTPMAYTIADPKGGEPYQDPILMPLPVAEYYGFPDPAIRLIALPEWPTQLFTQDNDRPITGTLVGFNDLGVPWSILTNLVRQAAGLPLVAH